MKKNETSKLAIKRRRTLTFSLAIQLSTVTRRKKQQLKKNCLTFNETLEYKIVV